MKSSQTGQYTVNKRMLAICPMTHSFFWNNYNIYIAKITTRFRKWKHKKFHFSCRWWVSVAFNTKKILNKYSTLTVCSSHLSNVSDLTLDTCTPRLRCIPEHSIQTKIPKLMLAQSGPTTNRVTSNMTDVRYALSC